MTLDPSDEPDIELKAYAVPPVVIATGGRRKEVSYKRHGHFISAMPMIWAVRACAATAPAAAIMLAIRYQAGFTQGQPIDVSLEQLSLGVTSTDTVRRMLKRLERDRLIRVEHPPGRKLRITVLDVVELGCPGRS